MSAASLLLPDFLLIALGVVLIRARWFDASFWRGIERLVYFVLFPSLLIRSLATSPLSPTDAAKLVGVGIAFTAVGMLLSALARPVLRLPGATFAACFQCGFRFNTYIALAVAARLPDPRAIALIGLLIGILVPIVNVAAVAALARGGARAMLPELARNPLVLACAIGIAWNALHAPMPAVLMRVLELIGSAAVPLGLLAVGAGLRFEKATLPPIAIAWWHGVKLVALPATTYVLAALLDLSSLERQVAVLMAAVPTATSAYILATRMNAPGAPVALLISTGTLLAAITLPIWLQLAS